MGTQSNTAPGDSKAMKSSLSSSFLLAFVILWLTPVQAQTIPQSIPSAPTTGWQQLESTYQNELKKIHLPLLSAYINELTRLASTSRSSEATVAINRELQELQSIIAAGGVVDFLKPNSEDNPSTDSTKPPQPKSKPETLLDLRPETATEITPTPPHPLPPAVSVQTITWTIDALPKGEFEVICQGAITSIDSPATLVVKAGNQTLKLPLAKRHVATDTESLRLIHIGVIKFADEVAKLTFELSLETTATPPPSILIRQILIARSKPAPIKKTP